MTKRQKKTLQLVREFTPSWIKDWNHPDIIFADNQIGIGDIKQSSRGKYAYEAFFSKTERGIIPKEVKNIVALRKLLWGHKWMPAHVKMWKEGISEGTFFAFELKPLWRKLL